MRMFPECDWCFEEGDENMNVIEFRGLTWTTHDEACTNMMRHDLMGERDAEYYPEPIIEKRGEK